MVEFCKRFHGYRDVYVFTIFSAPTSAFSTYKGTISYVDGVVVWSEPTLNIGSHYNTTTGKYCAEHSGTYLFQLNLVKKSLLASVVCSLFKESDRIGDAWVPTETIWAGQFESSTTAIVHLVQGECVYVGGCNGFSNMADTTTFTGTLLFQDSD